MTYVARLPSSDICLKETKQRRSYAMIHVYDVYVRIKHKMLFPQIHTTLDGEYEFRTPRGDMVIL